MAANLFPFFNSQFFTDLGVPAAGYVLYQYASGTTTNQATFTDLAGTISNANPIILDGAGRCTMFGGTAAYTFVLKVSVGGATVKTWDNVSAIPIVTATSALPLAGGTMLGPIVLSADATANLNPTSLQQMNAAIAASASTLTAAVASANAAAAAATAAAAGITPTSFRLYSANGGAVTRTVSLTAGTWAVIGETRASVADGSVTGSYDATTTQAFTVSTTTVNTSIHLSHLGSSGYGRDQHGTGLATGTLTVAATTSVTMSIGAASLGSMTGRGSILTLEKQ